MVTNTGATTGQSNVKENGDSGKDGQAKDEYSNLKRNSNDVTKPSDKPDDDNQQQSETDRPKFSQTPGTNGMPSSAYQGRPYTSNGVPPTHMGNGPQGPSTAAPGYPPYGSYNHTGYPGKPGMRPMHNTPGYPNHMQRYPTQNTGGTPTLNQLLTTPSKYPAQYPGYHPSTQQSDYPHQPQAWQGRPTHYPRPMDPSTKTPDMAGYPQPHQYIHDQQPGYGGQPRYPHIAPPGAQSPHQQQDTQQVPAPTRTPDSISSTHSRITEQHMMSPNRNTPQPTHHPHDPASGGTVPSPQVHPPHPSVAQLRGPSAPGSPASVGNPRSNPMSPPMKPGTPQQNRPSSEHPDQNIPSHSPMPGYGHYRPQTSQSSYGPPNPVPPNYPQHMVSPQQYPGGQQYPTTPQHPHAPQMRPAGPPSGGKPGQMMSPHGYTQAQQSPVYQGVPYYEGSHQHTVQDIILAGYNTSSPAPSERRPSRQGSHPSAQQTDQGGRQGAAAAAAAAMVAAAHSAQPMSQPAPRNPTPTYYPPGPPTSQPQQAPRPHYNLQQGGEMYQQNMGFPRMPHPGVQGSSPAQGMMGPPGPPQATQRMPASSTPYGYPLQPSHPQYPGYYPPNSGESHPAPHGYNPPQSNYETPPPPPVEETPKPKSSARSASQKLAALFEPSDEPGRRDFIDSVLRYWEDKDLPLKNAPLMGRKTLDLFHLYHKVKDRGGMQEVTSGKKWAEISTEMGLGTSSTSGFTLKKQYCKYLYGYECRVERGQEEPHEAMASPLVKSGATNSMNTRGEPEAQSSGRPTIRKRRSC
uniref:AT-rich interactive domain-containing protein 1A-like n=1 Tax=Ciona intestinalis TaxID=7719 RepID=UPI00089DAB9F|nr:AT-rich interactive domain-containing protein 1A-like [Ciona intestinalis]|eukprot:XP_018669792.1 AT-rich interactive domain-containing protein 1A-like [Ciona intestinalis]